MITQNLITVADLSEKTWDRFDKIVARLAEAGVPDQHEVHHLTPNTWTHQPSWQHDCAAVLLALAAVQQMSQDVLALIPYRIAPLAGVNAGIPEVGLIADLSRRPYNVVCDALVALVEANVVAGEIRLTSGHYGAWNVKVAA